MRMLVHVRARMRASVDALDFNPHARARNAQELWTELTSKAERQAQLAALPPGKLLLVEYYVSWCDV
jgi:aminoglycoside phosphotransferase